MRYVYWLAGLSLFFIVLERLRPRDRSQRFFRRGLLTDAFYLVFNGHFLGVLLAYLADPTAAWLDRALESVQLREALHANLAASWPLWVQGIVAFVGIDFLQWNIHRLLHRVPWLWEVHKVHHSARPLDWAASLRFHWGEIIVYKSLSYPVLALLGFDGDVLFVLAVVSTAIGHFNHANLGVNTGPLKYVFNSPEMHVWHHVHPDAGPPNHNFAINLALWDWLFGTAHLPDHPPTQLGFEDIDAFPTTAPGQLLHPLPLERWWRRLIGASGRNAPGQ